MPNTNWSEPSITNSTFVEPSVVPSAYTEASQDTTTWVRTSGIDTSIPVYDDSTISYDDSTEYYDGYNANTITEEDVVFAQYTSDVVVTNTAWTDIT